MAHAALVLNIFVLSLISLSSSKFHHHHPGACPTDVVTKQNVDMNKLLGTWIEYGVYGTKPSKKLVCTRFVFEKPDEGDIIMTERVRFRRLEHIKKSKLIIAEPSGTYDVKSAYDDASSASKKEGEEEKETLVVLDTDYDCWAVTYSCKEKIKAHHIKYHEIEARVFLKRSSDTCVNARRQDSYQKMITETAKIDNPFITWQNIAKCK